MYCVSNSKKERNMTHNENSNIILWEAVKETNPKFTKPVTQGKRTYTSICSTYQAQIATEKFGLYGKGWGLSKSKFNWEIFEQSGMVIHEAEFFYTWEGEKTTFDLHNAQAIKGKYRDGGEKWDADFAKKVETNTISKALAKLGFSADIFMGKFEDQDYLEEQRLKAGMESIEMEPDVLAEKKKEFFKWCEDQINAYPSYNESALKGVYNDNMKKARAKCDLLGVRFAGDGEIEGVGDKFEAAMKKRREEIKDKNKS